MSWWFTTVIYYFKMKGENGLNLPVFTFLIFFGAILLWLLFYENWFKIGNYFERIKKDIQEKSKNNEETYK